MIKSTELRIGNLVNVPRPDQSPFRIDGFEYFNNSDGKIYQNNGTYETPFGEMLFHPLTWELKDIEPIPLTPEILEKAGFERYGKWWSFNDLQLGLENYIAIQNWITPYKTPEYLHQLQNLYYALCGTELTITF